MRGKKNTRIPSHCHSMTNLLTNSAHRPHKNITLDECQKQKCYCFLTALYIIRIINNFFFIILFPNRI